MKTILPAAQTYLNTHTKIKTAMLISMELPGSDPTASTFAYYTDYFRDITYRGIPYRAGKIKVVGAHKQDRQLSIGTLSFTITGADDVEVIKLVQQGVSFIDRNITILQAIIDDNGEIMAVDPDTNGPIQFFRGKITSGGIRDDVTASDGGSSTITWTCSNAFYDFEQVNGRVTDDASHRGLEVVNGKLEPSNGAKREEYKEDYGFYHSNQSVNILAQYQVKELRYKMKSKKKFFGLSKSYSLVEYYETVTKEVDLDLNLAAKYLPVVYGVQQIPGIPVFADTEKDNPNVVYVVYAFCEGEIDGFLDFYFGDNPMICVNQEDSQARTCFGTKKIAGDTMQRIASGQPSTATSVHGQEYVYNDGNGDIRIWTYHGKRDQTAAQVLVDLAARKGFYLQNQNGNGPEYWDSRYKLLDTAYAVVRFTITENRTDIPDLAAEVQGKKIRVYKSDGSYDASKTSLNPIWQTLDYLTSDLYGPGVTLDQFTMSQLLQEAAVLNTIDTSYEMSWQPYWRYVGWTSNANVDFRQMVQLNTVVDTADTVFKNVQALLDAFKGALNNLSGTYRLTVEKYSKTPRKIHYLDTTGSIDLQDTTGRSKYNSVQASLIDPALMWKTNSVTFFNSEYKNQDKGADKRLQLSFAYITNYYTARAFAERELKKSRYSRQLTITVPYSFVGIECNDPIAFTYPRYGWVDKFFLVDSVENTRDGKINLVLQEYAEDVFINSAQVDKSGTDIPNVTNSVLPPRDFKYVPTPISTSKDFTTIGKNGELTWLPSFTGNVIYYTILQSGRLDPYVVDQLTQDPNVRLKQDIMGQPAGLYIFEIRAVDVNGRRSSPVTLTVELNAARNLAPVSNFRALNALPSDGSEFTGPDLLLAWDPNPEEDLLEGLYYELELSNSVGTMLRSIRIENQWTYDYLLLYNKQDYATQNSGKIGINRRINARIRAKGPNGEQSVTWTTL